ncbi:hypothetical protein B7463_g9529, partial [Scytalidium lignicola]
MFENRIRKPRLPSGRACLSCQKRKNRCDGGRPECGSCKSRWVTCQYLADLTRATPADGVCHPTIASVQDKHIDSGEQHNRRRSKRQQRQQSQTQESTLPLSSFASNQSKQGLNLTWSIATDPVHSDEATGSSSDTQLYHSNATQSGIPSELHTVDSRASSPGDSDSSGYFGDSSAFALVSKVSPEYQQDKILNPPTKQSQGLASSHGVQSPEVPVRISGGGGRDPHYSLPNRHLTDALVDEFFDFYNPHYPFIHEPSFRAKYEKMWDAVSESTFRPSCNPERGGAGYFVSFCRAITRHPLVPCPKKWQYGTAVSIGLHLNPEELRLNTVEKETRKRVWWGCFIFDRTLSMKFGRPPLMQASRFDIPLPLAVDDQYVHNNGSTPRQPAGHPSTIPFFNHTIILSQVIDHILQDLYLARKKAPQDSLLPAGSRQSYILGHAVLLDGELQSWWSDVPTHIRLESDIPQGHVFQRQQLVTYVSREDITDDFFRSVAIAGSRACISAAQETIRLIYDKYHRRLLNSLCYNLHYMFVSMGVLLHLHTMDKFKLQLLGLELENESLELGMEFMKSVSKSSSLAAKYIALIQRVRAQIQQKNAQGDSSNNSNKNNTSTNENSVGSIVGGAINSSQTEFIDDDMQSFLASIEMAAGDNDPANFSGNFDLDFMNLFGMGLPQDVVFL